MMPEGFKALDRKDVLSTPDFQKRIAMIVAKKDSVDIFEVSLSPEAVEVIWEYGDMVTIATTSMGDFAIIPGIDRDAKNARDFDIGIANDDHFFRWEDTVVCAYLRQHQSFKGKDGKFRICGRWDEKNRCLIFDLYNKEKLFWALRL